METTLPGIGQYKSQIPVKVTNMQLVSGPFHDRSLGAMLHLNDEFIQQELQRGLPLLISEIKDKCHRCYFQHYICVYNDKFNT